MCDAMREVIQWYIKTPRPPEGCMETLCPCTWPFVIMPSAHLYCLVHLVTFSIVIAIILSTDPPLQALSEGVLLPTDERKRF